MAWEGVTQMGRHPGGFWVQQRESGLLLTVCVLGGRAQGGWEAEDSAQAGRAAG